jgi:hypothetical protein
LVTIVGQQAFRVLNEKEQAGFDEYLSSFARPHAGMTSPSSLNGGERGLIRDAPVEVTS